MPFHLNLLWVLALCSPQVVSILYKKCPPAFICPHLKIIVGTKSYVYRCAVHLCGSAYLCMWEKSSVMWNDTVSLVLAGHGKLRNILVQILLDEWKNQCFLSSLWHPKYQSRYYFSKRVLYEVEIWSWRQSI